MSSGGIEKDQWYEMIGYGICDGFFGSSRSQIFFKIGVLKNLTNSAGKQKNTSVGVSFWFFALIFWSYKKMTWLEIYS